MRRKNEELHKENENLKQKIADMSENILPTDNEIKAMKEEMEMCRRQMAKYEITIANMMEELRRGKDTIESLEEIIRAKNATIEECMEQQNKAANEETYTQVMGQSNTKPDGAPPLSRGVGSASSRAQDAPRRQDAPRMQEVESTSLQDRYIAFNNRGQPKSRRMISRQSSTLSRQTSMASVNAESLCNIDMITQVVTGIMSEVMTYTRGIVENKINEALGLPRSRIQPSNNSTSENPGGSKAPSAVTWANRVQGMSTITADVTRNIINADEFPPLGYTGGAGRTGGNQASKKDARQHGCLNPTRTQVRRDQHGAEPLGMEEKFMQSQPLYCQYRTPMVGPYQLDKSCSKIKLCQPNMGGSSTHQGLMERYW